MNDIIYILFVYICTEKVIEREKIIQNKSKLYKKKKTTKQSFVKL